MRKHPVNTTASTYEEVIDAIEAASKLPAEVGDPDYDPEDMVPPSIILSPAQARLIAPAANQEVLDKVKVQNYLKQAASTIRQLGQDAGMDV